MPPPRLSTSTLLAVFLAFIILVTGSIFVSHNTDSILLSLKNINLPFSLQPSPKNLAASHLERYTAERCGDPDILFDTQHDICQNMAHIVTNQCIYASHTADTNYLACVPPKNGCTYHKGLLHRIRGVKDYQSMPSIHGKDTEKPIKLEAWTNEHVAMAFLNLSMPKYAVVRNPITRLLSAYIDKVEDFAPKDQRTVKDFKKWVYKEFPKGGRVSRDWMKVNAHWRPQSFFCGFRTYNLDEHFEIFRVEDPEGYVNFIYDHIPAKYLDSGWGKDLTTSFREFVLGPRSRTTGSTNKKLEYFQDLQFFDHVAEELRDDIRLLGYEDEIALMREEIVKLNAAEKSGALED